MDKFSAGLEGETDLKHFTLMLWTEVVILDARDLSGLEIGHNLWREEGTVAKIRVFRKPILAIGITKKLWGVHERFNWIVVSTSGKGGIRCSAYVISLYM
jgi:hypothetical protein